MPHDAPAPVNVLLVDEDPDCHALTRALLDRIGGGAYRLDWAPHYDEGLAALRSGRHEACLLDYRLGDRTGVEFLREAAAGGCTVPVIVLTGCGGGPVEREVLAAGAADYLAKDRVDAELLGRALRHAVERNRAFQAVRERDRLFRAVFDASHDAMLIADDGGRYVDGNPAALALLGVTRAGLVGRRVHDLTPEVPAGAVDAAWERFLREGSQSGEWTLAGPGGEARTLEFRATANILPGRHLSVLRDVTERRRAEALRRRLAAIVEAAEDAIVGKDLDGTIREWNPGAERVYGCPAAEAVGTPVTRFVPVDRLAEWAHVQRQVREGRTVRNLETVRMRHDGRLVDVSVTVSPLRDSSGAVAGACTITRDITETRRLRARLAIADRMASMGTLAAGVAHEINNPLAVVVANLDAATRELGAFADELGLTSRMRDVLDGLRDASYAAQRVGQIVRDLKLFSRPDAEAVAPVDVRRAIGSAVRMVWNEIRHRARLVEDYGETPPVHANEARLGQVFLNLLVNAAQAIPEGDAQRNEIHVATRAEGGRVVVEVRDTGPGIDPAHVDRIFEPFFTTKPPGQGTGLGLSICHGIVRGLGGEIAVESAPGRGATFRVALPVGAAIPAAGTAPPPAPAALLRGRVLVVDDEPAVGRAVARALAPHHDVTTLHDAQQALALARAGERFDVILCDLMMPQTTGMDLYDGLRREAPELAGRVVFMTGGAFTPRAREFLDRVPNARVDKPFNRAELVALIDALLRRPHDG